MTPIQTGYIPDGALGAMYAGQNAANAEDESLQNLAKLFMANQKEQQMAPLDIQAKQLSIAPAQYEDALSRAKMASSSYIPSVLQGYEGQMNSQIAAGEKATSLMPMQIDAEKSKLENEKTAQGFQWTLNDIDKKLQAGGDTDPSTGQVVPFTQPQIGFMKQRREQLMQQMMDTPEYRQKDALANSKYEMEMAKAQMAMEARIRAAQESAQAAVDKANGKQPTTFEASIVQDIQARIASGEITPAQGREELSVALQAKQKNAQNPGMVLSVDGSGTPSFGPSNPVPAWRPTQSQKLSPQDEQAIAWAQANPNDPRAQAIMAKLKGK